MERTGGEMFPFTVLAVNRKDPDVGRVRSMLPFTVVRVYEPFEDMVSNLDRMPPFVVDPVTLPQ